MAFVMEQEKKKIEWMPILIGVFVVAFFGGAIYYLFFSAASPIEGTLTQSDLQKSATELQAIGGGQDTVLNHPIFRSAAARLPAVTAGEVGRSNPFQPTF